MAPPNLVAWYKGNGDALDSSGNDLHGTWSGTEAYGAGPRGGAFDHTQNGLVSANSSYTELRITGQLTISLWAKRTGDFPINQFLTGRWVTSPANRSYWLSGAGNNEVRFNISDDGTFQAENSVVSAGNPLPLNEWTHIVAVFVPEVALRLYMNGRLVASKTTSVSSSIFAGSAALRQAFYCGLISDAMIFDRALSEQEIRDIMILTSPAKGHHPNLVAWYPGNGNAFDMSGNGHHGTWEGTPAYAEGKFGQGFEFDGASSANVNYDSSLNTDDITVSFWVRHAPIWACVVTRRNSADASLYSWEIEIASTEIRWCIGGNANRPPGIAPIHNEWVHYAFTATNGDGVTGYAEIYRNGVRESQGNVSPWLRSVSASLVIGARGLVSSPSFFEGLINDLRIYNAALTPSDIKRVMHGVQPIGRV